MAKVMLENQWGGDEHIWEWKSAQNKSEEGLRALTKSGQFCAPSVTTKCRKYRLNDLAGEETTQVLRVKC